MAGHLVFRCRQHRGGETIQTLTANGFVDLPSGPEFNEAVEYVEFLDLTQPGWQGAPVDQVLSAQCRCRTGELSRQLVMASIPQTGRSTKILAEVQSST